MLQLINNRRLMGRFVSRRVFNVIAWAMVAVLILLTLILIVVSVFPGLQG
jgi:Mn2+/Fe2+ NRAMP family transporter